VPVKQRIAKDRRPQFSREVLELFVELEALPRGSQRFKVGSKRLADLLGLMDAWWAMQHVNDRSAGPCHPPYKTAFADWHTCREMRLALLAAAGLESTTVRRPVRARHSVQ
jgi:hypothetical protein